MVKNYLQKQAKSEVLRARCDSQLKLNVASIASRLMLDESDVVRMAIVDYVKKVSEKTTLSIG